MPHSSLATALGAGDNAPPPRTKSYLTLPLLLLAAFTGLFAWATWERWLPRKEVTTVRVETIRRPVDAVQSAAPSASGNSKTALFKATGWIEPDPFVTQATALVSGVIANVSVRQGDLVTAGQELARLDDRNFQFALNHAQAELPLMEADLKQAEAQVLVLAAEEKRLLAQKAKAGIAIQDAVDLTQRRSKAGQAVSQRLIREAELAHQSALQDLADVDGALLKLAAQQQAATADIAKKQASLTAQQVFVKHAASDLERCIIKAPIDGRILRLHAYPGRKQMLGSDSPTSATVAEIYDPNKLQVRVDVALVDAAGLHIGQAAELSSEVWPGKTFAGVVTRIEGHADLTRNTLQAKVSITDPLPSMRPDMLCRVSFLSSASPSGPANSGELPTITTIGGLMLLVPAHAVDDQTHSQIPAWLIDGEQRAQATTLQTGDRYRESIEILSGAPAGSLLITNPPPDLQDGELVTPIEGGSHP